MAGNSSCFLQAILFFLLLGFSASTTFISVNVFESHGSTGRNLLQEKKGCPVIFEFANYTIITSKCKGPQYPAKPCCEAFLEFACPYADELNDGSNDCSATMFSYINLYGKYPPGLFASECKGDKEGLVCPADPPQLENTDANSGHVVQSLFLLVVLVSGSVLAFLFS